MMTRLQDMLGKLKLYQPSVPADFPGRRSGSDIFKAIRHCLGIVVLGLFVLLVLDLSRQKEDSGVLLPVSATAASDAPVESAGGMRPQGSSIEEEQVFRDRDFFAPALSASAVIPEPSGAEGIEQGVGFDTGKYRLVGVMIDKDPKAVVELEGGQEVAFLSLGENIDGAVITEIRQDRIILSFNGQPLEIVCQPLKGNERVQANE